MRAVGAGLQPGSAARRQQLQRAATACAVRGWLRAAPLAGRAAGVCGGRSRQAGAANILLDTARGFRCRPWVRGGGRAQHPTLVPVLKTEGCGVEQHTGVGVLA